MKNNLKDKKYTKVLAGVLCAGMAYGCFPIQAHAMGATAQINQTPFGNLALMSDGTVKAWGDNSMGVLGLGDTANHPSPTTIQGLTGVKQLLSSYNSSYALMSDGTVKVWGNNDYNGQLGLGTSNDSSYTRPITIPGLTGVKQLFMLQDTASSFSPNKASMFALMNDGTVKAWGDNSMGQLGLGDTNRHLSPTTISGLTGVTQMFTCDLNSTFAKLSNGTVKAWGIGNLGNGVENSQFSPTTRPVTVSGLTGAKQIYSDYESYFAIMSDNTVKAWGANDDGQLGLGEKNSHLSPVTISGLTNVKQLAFSSGGGRFAVMNDGTVKIWGDNTNGALGTGNRDVYVSRPTILSALTGATKIDFSKDSYEGCALMSNGTVKAWGNDHEIPQTIPGLSGVKDITSDSQGFAFLTSGQVKTWSDPTNGSTVVPGL